MQLWQYPKLWIQKRQAGNNPAGDYRYSAAQNDMFYKKGYFI